MDGKINKTKQTVTPFLCLPCVKLAYVSFLLSEVFSSFVSLAVPPTGGGGGGGREGWELVHTKQTETPLLFTSSEVLHKFF